MLNFFKNHEVVRSQKFQPSDLASLYIKRIHGKPSKGLKRKIEDLCKNSPLQYQIIYKAVSPYIS